jgi:hypothetical protein
MAILRTAAQKKVLDELSVFWLKGKTAMKTPWKIECIKGKLYIRFWYYAVDREKITDLGVMLDWCQDRNIEFKFHGILENVMGWSRMRAAFMDHRWPSILTILIKPEGY